MTVSITNDTNKVLSPAAQEAVRLAATNHRVFSVRAELEGIYYSGEVFNIFPLHGTHRIFSVSNPQGDIFNNNRKAH